MKCRTIAQKNTTFYTWLAANFVACAALTNTACASDSDILGYVVKGGLAGGPAPMCLLPNAFGHTPLEAASQAVANNDSVMDGCNGPCHNPASLISVDPTALIYVIQSECTGIRYQNTISPIRDPKQPVCKGPFAGNPCNLALGAKVQSEVDYSAPGKGNLTFSRVYNSASSNLYPTALGPYWQSNYDRFAPQFNASYTTSAVQALGSVQFWRVGGQVITFYYNASLKSWVGDPDVPEQLVELSDTQGNHVGWRLYSDNTQEVYDSAGRLNFIIDENDVETALSYNTAGQLLSVRDAYGRSISFAYYSNGKLNTLTTPNGDVFLYEYDTNGMLYRVHYPVPGSSTTSSNPYRQYHYDSPYGNYLLTGLDDENTNRFATWDYDNQKRAILSVHGNATSLVDRNSIVYNPDTSVTVTDALGASRTYGWVDQLSVRKLGAVDVPCVGCDFGNAHMNSYDSNGYPASVTDFNGTVTNYTYDDTRGLETKRVEAVGTPEQRTTNTQWDPNFRVPDERDVDDASGPESVTKWVYNTRGQVTARCDIDPADPVAMGYTCSDTTAPPAGAKVRRTVTAYCEDANVCGGVGLVVSVDGPRTDVSDVTNYSYYLSDDPSCAPTPILCPHRKGNLWKITNARGQVTTYVSYDPNGRVTRMQGANGIYTDMTYHPRGWLLTRTIRANADGTPNASLDATTTFSYDNLGNVIQVTQPDGSYLHYLYDAAHRLTDVYDSATLANYLQGNHIHYTLDAAGNRSDEQTSDTSGTLKRELSRQYDQLDHLTGLLNASMQPIRAFENPPSPETPPAGVTYTNGYDGNGNAIYSVDANGVGTEQQYDPLNRLKTTLQDHAGTTTTKDTTTQYAYDARDNLASVTDPDNLVTHYTYDGLNNLTQLDSPDTGTTLYPSYDGAGNRLEQTDANGITVNYTYDALNRLTGITYPTTSLNVTFTYDVPATGCYNIGRLTQITDSSGSTTYCYDPRGNVLTKTQVTNGATLTTGYTYTLADRILTITYPSGAIVTYGRDTVGRITSVTYQANATATAQTIASNASYYPFGPLNTLTFGNGRTLTKTYDQDYAIGTVASSDSNGLAISAGVDALGNLTHASNGANPPSQTYGYDNLYRLTGVTDSNNNTVEGYTYGLTGDRLTKTYQGQTNVYDYTSPLSTHQLQDIDGAGRGYDANGNLVYIGSLSRFGNTMALTFDDRNRLVGAAPQSLCMACGQTTASYDYNGRGERVTKSVASGNPQFNIFSTTTTDYVYNESGQLLGEYPGTSGVSMAEYIYLDATPIAYVTNGTLYYLETDQLGTTRTVVLPGTTTAPDTVMWKWDYFGSAFGENAPNEDPNSTGTAFTFNLRFPGQYYDAETGLNYNYFRDYEPGTGRYVESDPIGLGGGSNLYTYVANMPLRALDPSGLLHTGSPKPGSQHAGSVYCDGGQLMWYVNAPDEHCYAIVHCAEVHEKTHTEDIFRNQPTLCSASQPWYKFWGGAQQIYYDSVSEMKTYEYHAFSNELYCLASFLNSTCTNCDNAIKQRMWDIQYALIPKVEAGTYGSD